MLTNDQTSRIWTSYLTSSDVSKASCGDRIYLLRSRSRLVAILASTKEISPVAQIAYCSPKVSMIAAPVVHATERASKSKAATSDSFCEAPASVKPLRKDRQTVDVDEAYAEAYKDVLGDHKLPNTTQSRSRCIRQFDIGFR
jgi:hypothetical protein